jgi:hypothetical protein
MATLDNATFRTLNGDAEIFPNKANYWVIVVRRPDLLKMNPETRLNAATDIVEGLFRDLMIDHEELRALDVWPAEGVPKGNRYGLVQPQPMTYPEGSVYISLTWDAQGPRASVPWPWEYRGTSWQDVQVGLVSVHQPGSIVTVPDALDGVIQAAGATATQIKDELPALGKDVLLWVGVGVASVFALSRAFR